MRTGQVVDLRVAGIIDPLGVVHAALHSAIASATVNPTAIARVIAAARMPVISSPGERGGISRSMIVPCILPDSRENDELANAFCIIAITIRPGATKVAKGTPRTSRAITLPGAANCATCPREIG